jgi:hypothetical protein
MASMTTVYGLFGPAGFLGVYSSAEGARIAGDYWAQAQDLRCAQPWTPESGAPEGWQRELQATKRPGAVAGILRLRPLPLNGKPTQDW